MIRPSTASPRSGFRRSVSIGFSVFRLFVFSVKEFVMIVTIASAKGGVAKTTSAVFLCLARVLAADGTALLLDADPQGSASMWADMAVDGGCELPFDVAPANLATLRRVRREHPSGFVVVDAPPEGKLFEESIAQADFVIVPTSDSPLDLQQAWATVAAVPASVPAAVLPVRVEPGTVACRETLAALREHRTPCFDTVVRKRQDVKQAMGSRPGKLWEYAQVYRELMGVVA